MEIVRLQLKIIIFGTSDRLYDRDLFLAMKLQEEEFEEGEIRKED